MAKKNLSALMSGIMGQPEQEMETTSSAEPAKEGNATQADTAPSHGGRKRGRPAKGGQKERATFIVDPDLLRKVKYIALVDDIMQMDIVDAALRRYVADWEVENGRVRLPHKKN